VIEPDRRYLGINNEKNRETSGNSGEKNLETMCNSGIEANDCDQAALALLLLGFTGSMYD